MKRGGNLERKRKPRRERTRVLIVTEGTETEEQYFGILVQHLKATGVRHWPMTRHGVGRDPLRVLKAAVSRRDAADLESFDSVWVVVDVDQHATLTSCLKEAEKEGVSVVVSNPCFEIWLLWHLRDHRRPETTPGVQEVLKTAGYSGKSVSSNFPVHEFEKASARARQADPNCRVGSVGSNPSSSMDQLLSHIVSV